MDTVYRNYIQKFVLYVRENLITPNLYTVEEKIWYPFLHFQYFLVESILELRIAVLCDLLSTVVSRDGLLRVAHL